jgi:LCP family protein required for cell wall assembly
MMRHRKNTKRPKLFLEGDQPHLYRKRRLKIREMGGHIEESKEPHLYLDGDQPHIRRRRRIRWTSVLKWGSLALVIILIILFAWGYVWLKSKESKMRTSGVDTVLDAKQKGQPVTTLIMGIDKGSVPGEEGQSRTDIMMLVSVNPANKKAAVISIPRDSRVEIPGRSGYNKINAAHSFGGPKMAIQTVKDFTGLNINHYVEIDFEGFKRIVDSIGGVKMHIDVAIHDKYAGDVPAGDVVLNGDQALALVRARHDPRSVPAGDLDRIKNQRRFLQAMLSTVSHTRNPLKVIKLVDVASENIKTDLTFTEMLSLGRRLQGAGGNDLTMTTVPGKSKVIGGVWYYIVDMPQFQSMLETFKTKQEVDAKVEEQASANISSRSTTKLAVLNGSGDPGLASAVASELAQAGYIGIKTGNAESRYSKTTIYYTGDESSKAGMIAADLAGVQEPMIQSNDGLTSSHGVDVVVVLGSDYVKP